jgi:hypothetical protein
MIQLKLTCIVLLSILIIKLLRYLKLMLVGNLTYSKTIPIICVFTHVKACCVKGLREAHI